MVKRWQSESGWVLVDPELEWTVSKENMLSKGKNTPLIQQKVQGKVVEIFLP